MITSSQLGGKPKQDKLFDEIFIKLFIPVSNIEKPSSSNNFDNIVICLNTVSDWILFLGKNFTAIVETLKILLLMWSK